MAPFRRRSWPPGSGIAWSKLPSHGIVVDYVRCGHSNPPETHLASSISDTLVSDIVFGEFWRCFPMSEEFRQLPDGKRSFSDSGIHPTYGCSLPNP